VFATLKFIKNINIFIKPYMLAMNGDCPVFPDDKVAHDNI
jgi:hypothetical protein